MFGQECDSSSTEIRFCLLRESKAEDERKPPPACIPRTCLLFLKCRLEQNEVDPSSCKESLPDEDLSSVAHDVPGL